MSNASLALLGYTIYLVSSMHSIPYLIMTCLCLASLLGYVNSDELSNLFFSRTIYPSSGSRCTGILYSGSDIEILFSSILGKQASFCALRNIFIFSAVSVIFQFTYLMSLVMTTLLLSALYNLSMSIV